MITGSGSGPSADDPVGSQAADPQSGMSDDPRVDPTPDRRQTDGPGGQARNALGVADPTAGDGPPSGVPPSSAESQ